MKPVKKFLKLTCCSLLFSIGLSNLSAQSVLTKKPNININSNIQGFLEILPSGYTTAQKYPTIFFFMGINSTGPGTSASLETMITAKVPPDPEPTTLGNGYIQDQVKFGIWPDNFTVNGNTHKFIVIVPQFVTNYNTRPPTPAEINDLINYTISNYSVDTTRMYITGNSSGGGPVWDYPAASSNYANRIAAIVPFTAVVFPSKEKADVIRNANVAVWAFHNQFDAGVPVAFTQDFVSMINEPTPAVPQVKETIFPVSGHDSWYAAYNRTYTENGLNIYEWMLQFQRTVTKANAGVDQNITLPVSSAQLDGSGTGPNGSVTTYNWQQVSGPSSAGISNVTVLNPSVSGLIAGTYIFRLTIADNAAGTSIDDVAITVYPVRIEAEIFTSTSGGTSTATTTDEGGGSVVTFNNSGNWIDYNINVPASGTYVLRFRVSSFFQNPQFVVKNSAGAILATVNVYWTNGYDNYITMARTISQPANTTQTIRIEATFQAFNLNWLQVLTAPSAAPLPVKYSLFNANCVNGFVNLTWKTAIEINTANFSVEKSSDGRSWNSIATIAATGQGGTEQTYNFRDNTTGNNSLYRIIANDVDNKKTYSSIIRSNCNGKQDFSIYPNPVYNDVQLNISAVNAAKVRLSVIDNKGAVVFQQQENILTGVNQLSINLSSLSKGAYILNAQWNGESKTVKLIKQ
jgi:dienelactone hydrolase